MKGPERPVPFQALVQSDESAPATANGVMLQEQVLPAWLMPAIATAAVVLAALVVLWYTVLKPQVHTMATQAVQAVTSQLSSNAVKASQAAVAANSAAAAASSAAAKSRTNEPLRLCGSAALRVTPIRWCPVVCS